MWWLSAWALILGCKADAPEDSGEAPLWSADEVSLLQRLSPLGDVPADPTNAMADDDGAANLGQWLYFDARLSVDGKVSCATCHDPALAFTDGLALSQGVADVPMHAPTVINAAYNRWFFWDGRADSLWAQALGPIENDLEQGTSRTAAAHLIDGDSALRAAYISVFGDLPDLSDPKRFPADAKPLTDVKDPRHLAWEAMDPKDQLLVNTVFANVGKAIAAYERKVVTGPAPFDVFVEGLLEDDTTKQEALSEEAQRGLRLFLGDALCFNCHLGPSISNREFHNIGLGPRDGLDAEDLGRYEGIVSVLSDPFNGAGAFSDDPAAGAEGIAYIKQGKEQLGQYKVPNLRNVALTPPYMHGGHFESLHEVVTFYSELDEEPDWGHREDLMVPLELSEEDIDAIVAFLESLTSIEGVSKELLQAPPKP